MDFSILLSSIDWTSIAGWIISPIITLTFNRFLAKRAKVVAYTITKSNFFSDAHARIAGQSLGSNIQIFIDGQLASYVNYVNIVFQNKTKEKLKSIKLSFAFGSTAYLYKYQVRVSKHVYIGDIREASRYANGVDIDVSFLDSNEAFDITFLLSNHYPDNVFVSAKCEDDEVRVVGVPEFESVSQGLSAFKLVIFTVLLAFLLTRMLPHIFVIIQAFSDSQ